MLVKKYGNRRLYDTDKSRYITLEELAASVKGGEEVRVVDAKTGEDLTTATLAQIIVEGRGAARMLPLPLLVQLIRMGDDGLAEFFGQYVGWALDAYLQTRQRAQAMNPFGPFFGAPFVGDLSRMFGLAGARAQGNRAAARPPVGQEEQQPPASAAPGADRPAKAGRKSGAPDPVEALRRELDDLKKLLKKRRR